MPKRKVKENQIVKSKNILSIARENSENIKAKFPDINFVYPGGRTLLALAIENGEDVRLVEEIVTSGADVNLQNAKGQSAMMFAARCKRKDVLKLLANLGAKLDLVNDKKMTALSICVADDYMEGVKTLVKSGSDVNLKTGKLNETAIEMAMRLKFKQIQDVLLSCNVAAVKGDKNLENTTFHEMANVAKLTHIVQSRVTMTDDKCNREVVNAFLQITRTNRTGQKLSFKTLYNLAVQLHKTQNLNIQDDLGRTFLMHSVMRSSEKSVNFICSLGADVNLQDNDGRTALMYVFISKLSLSTHTLCKLIGQNPCAQDKYGKSALMYAFENKFHLPLNLVKLLHGEAILVSQPNSASFFYFDIPLQTILGNIQNISDNEGKTHLMYAIMNIPNLDLDMLKILVGNQINARDRMGHSALIYALYYNRDLIEVLLNYGANPEIIDNEGKTALMIAMTLKLNFSETMLKFFIGKNINLQDKNGKTILMYALEHFASEREIDNVLRLGADVDIQDNEGKTALMYALNMSLLISNKCFRKLASGDVNKQDRLGRTALMYAIQYKANDEVLKTLMQCGSDVNIRDNLGKTVLEQLIGNNTSLCLFCSDNMNSFLSTRFGFLFGSLTGNNELSDICRFDIVQLILEHSTNLMLSKENSFIVTKVFKNHYNYNFNSACFKSKRILQLLLYNGIFLKAETVQGSKFKETSYLLVALELGHLDIAKYLMANYCTTNKDLRFLKSFYTSPMFYRSRFMIYFSLDREEKVSNEIIQFVERVTSQPWSLVTMSLIAISSTISFDENRPERVSKLPIPQLMKNYLMFRSPEATIPVSQWQTLKL